MIGISNESKRKKKAQRKTFLAKPDSVVGKREKDAQCMMGVLHLSSSNFLALSKMKVLRHNVRN